jgi:alanine racemase
MGTSKYNTGMYYKQCLYAGTGEWRDGALPGGDGELLAAICINKAIKQIDIAIDQSIENGKIAILVEDKINEGMDKLGVPQEEKLEYKRVYASTQGTILMPVFTRLPKKESLLKKILNKFSGKQKVSYKAK